MFDDHIKSLPSDLRIIIAKNVFNDMDTRIKTGMIGKLNIPDTIKARLENISIPSKMQESIYGIRLSDKIIVFKMVVGKDLFNCVIEEAGMIILKTE
jgi:hypothetical protein